MPQPSATPPDLSPPLRPPTACQDTATSSRTARTVATRRQQRHVTLDNRRDNATSRDRKGTERDGKPQGGAGRPGNGDEAGRTAFFHFFFNILTLITYHRHTPPSPSSSTFLVPNSKNAPKNGAFLLFGTFPLYLPHSQPPIPLRTRRTRPCRRVLRVSRPSHDEQQKRAKNGAFLLFGPFPSTQTRQTCPYAHI